MSFECSSPGGLRGALTVLMVFIALVSNYTRHTCHELVGHSLIPALEFLSESFAIIDS